MKLSEKIKLIRTAKKMTQEEFAQEIGISRVNLTNIELGKVKPTKLFITCVSLKFGISKKWLLDDDDDDLSYLNGTESSIVTLIAEKYDLLDDDYKKLVEHQILELLEIQKRQKDESENPFPEIPDTAKECLEKYPPIDTDGSESDIG